MRINLELLPDYQGTMDRRQKKTRLAIETALFELLETKPIENVTISELAEKADVNRKTFYNNYSSVEEVIINLNERISSSIYDKLPPKITINNEIEIYNLLLNYMTLLEPYRSLLKRIMSHQNYLITFEHFKNNLSPYVERNLLSYNVNPAVVPFINGYLLNGLSSIIYEWCSNSDLNAQQISLLCYNLIISSIKLDNYRDIMNA